MGRSSYRDCGNWLQHRSGRAIIWYGRGLNVNKLSRNWSSRKQRFAAGSQPGGSVDGDDMRAEAGNTNAFFPGSKFMSLEELSTLRTTIPQHRYLE
jgi:hypothetical protein